LLTPARVIRVEVCDDDPRDPAHIGPALASAGHAETGVDDGPPVVARQQVAVHVPDPHREREGQSADPAGKLLHLAGGRKLAMLAAPHPPDYFPEGVSGPARRDAPDVRC